MRPFLTAVAACLVMLGVAAPAAAAQFIIGDNLNPPISSELRFKPQLEALGLNFSRPAAFARLTDPARITLHLLAADGATTVRFTAGDIAFETGEYLKRFDRPLLLGSFESAGDLDFSFSSIVDGIVDRSSFFDPGFAIFMPGDGEGTRFTKTLYFGYDAGWAAGREAHDDLIIRATIDYVEGVPEPGSWALLITGFGLTGAALRRRRALAAMA